MRPAKVGPVARFEFLSTIRRPGYLIATFGMPVFLTLYGGVVVGIPSFFAAMKGAGTTAYGVVDRAGVLDLGGEEIRTALEVPPEVDETLRMVGQDPVVGRALEEFTGVVFRPFEDEEGARRALLGGQIHAFYLLDEDFLATGAVRVFVPDRPSLEKKKAGRDPLRRLVLERLLAGRVPEDVLERARRPVATWREFAVTEAGEIQERNPFAVFARIIVPILFMALMLISLMMTSSYMIQATAVEKENRVVEVLISSARPEEILAGKLLGLGAAGLLQVGVWFSMIIVGGLLFAAQLAGLGVEVPWAAIGAGAAYFVGGYLFIGSLMLGTGSIGSNQREVQQWSFVWSLLAVAPMMFLPILLEDPHGIAGRVLTWIPFTSPLTVVLRLTLGAAGIPWWEVAGSLALLAAATWGAVKLGARIFRVGLLLTGSRPRLREILRQARLSA